MNDNSIFDEYMTINEFSELVGITVDSLRHYDKRGVFMPATHGTGFERKYRYYSPMQVTVVKMIRVLAEIGVPLDTISELARNRTPEQLLRLLRKHRDIVADELRFLEEAHTVMDAFMDLLYEGITIMETEIHVSDMPEKRLAIGDINDFNGATGFIREFGRFCGSLRKARLSISYPIGGYFDSMLTFTDAPDQPTRFISLNPNGNGIKEAGLYVIGYTRGYYGQVNDLPIKMEAFAKNNGLLFSGPVYNIYLFDELSIADPHNYLLQVSASVTETRRVPSRRPRRKR